MTNKIFFLLSWISLMAILLMLTNISLHPVHMMILLLIYNIILCLNMSMWKTTFIFSILFFLIMISGLMIIFLYFSSLISNEKTWKKLNKPSMILMNTIILNMMLMIFNITPLIPSPQTHELYPLKYSFLIPSHSMIIPLFTTPYLFMTMLNMTYLLMALLLIMKMCAPKIKTMRKLT